MQTVVMRVGRIYVYAGRIVGTNGCHRLGDIVTVPDGEVAIIRDTSEDGSGESGLVYGKSTIELSSGGGYSKMVINGKWIPAKENRSEYVKAVNKMDYNGRSFALFW